MTASHTPGPWKVDESEAMSEATDSLALRLFAEAPAMLEALRAFVDDFGADFKGPTLDNARALLARIDGEAAPRG